MCVCKKNPDLLTMILDCDKTNLKCESVTKLGSLPDLHLPAGRPTSGDIKMGAGGIMPEAGALQGPLGAPGSFLGGRPGAGLG